MPIAVVASQARGIQAQDQARLAQTDLADQPLETVPFSTGCAGFAQVIVDDRDTLSRPAECDGAIHQMILKLGAFLMLADLTRRGLTDINIRKLRSMGRRNAFST